VYDNIVLQPETAQFIVNFVRIGSISRITIAEVHSLQIQKNPPHLPHRLQTCSGICDAFTHATGAVQKSKESGTFYISSEKIGCMRLNRSSKRCIRNINSPITCVKKVKGTSIFDCFRDHGAAGSA
jgi:hypothetical protein